jgi:hypothetical protein
LMTQSLAAGLESTRCGHSPNGCPLSALTVPHRTSPKRCFRRCNPQRKRAAPKRRPLRRFMIARV